MFRWMQLSFFFISLIASVQAQNLTYLANPSVEWRDDNFAAIDNGNGVFISPDGDVVLAISSSAFIRAYNAHNGSEVWNTILESNKHGGTVSTQSGITFSYNNQFGLPDYFVYSVVETVNSIPTTRVVARKIQDGSLLMESVDLNGRPTATGTPQTTADGRHVVLTHNVDFSGYFSLFDMLSGNISALDPLFQYFNDTNPFSPIGVFHNPEVGWYASDDNNGRNNRNDIFIFGFGIGPLTSNQSLNNKGLPFAFQFPIGYNFDGVGLTVEPLGNIRDTQSDTAPVLTNFGKSMYWALNRNSVAVWYERFFNLARGGLLDFPRYLADGKPFQGARASPVLSSDPVMPTVYGAAAGFQFWSANFNFSANASIDTDSLVYSRAVVSPDDQYVYFVTTNGLLYQWDGSSATARWVVGGGTSSVLLTPAYGDLAIHPSGTIVYVGLKNSIGVTGSVVAVRVGTKATAAPSPSPTVLPAPSSSPTKAPVGPSTARPSPLPATTDSPTSSPMTAPSDPSPTTKPATSPVSVPTTPTSPVSVPTAPTSPVSSPTMGSVPTNGGAPTPSPVAGSGAVSVRGMVYVSVVVAVCHAVFNYL